MLFRVAVKVAGFSQLAAILALQQLASAVDSADDSDPVHLKQRYELLHMYVSLPFC